jgi:hypothetical protein
MNTSTEHEQQTAPADDPGPTRGSNSRTTAKVLLAVVGVALVAWCALTVVSLLGRDTQRSSATYDNVTDVDLDLAFEKVTVVGQPGARQVSMKRSWTWSMSRPQVDAHVDGDRLTMTSRCSWTVGLGCSGSVQLVVPPGTAIRVHASDGDVSVHRITADVDIDSTDGDIDVADVTGSMRLRSTDGSVVGTDVRSSGVDAETTDGAVRLDFASAPDEVRAVSSDGGVEVLVPRDGQPWAVRASTSDGTRSVGVATDPAASRHIEAHSSDGSIRIAYRG